MVRFSSRTPGRSPISRRRFGGFMLPVAVAVAIVFCDHPCTRIGTGERRSFGRVVRVVRRVEGRGYVEHMPVFRPYPQNVIVTALERVVEVGDSPSRAVAEEWLSRLSGSLDTEWRVIQETRTQDGDLFHVKGGVGVALHGRLGPNVTVAGSLTGVLLDVEDGELLPRGERTDWDLPDDWSSISVAGRELAALSQANTSFAWGGDSLYLHAGIMRRSFGPFHDDGIVWSPQAFQSPGFVVHWAPGDFRFTAGLFSLTGTQLYNEATPLTASDANTDVISDTDSTNGAPGVPGADFILDPEEHPGKWVFLQDFRWQALPWLDLAFFESVTWGPRFEAAYLVPLKWTFNAQGNVGYADSSKMGLSAVLRPRRDLRLPFIVYVDDASFNDLARLDFDTKLKLGLQTGAIWTPEHPVLEQVKVDYTALFPYMYTHDGEGGVYAPVPNFTTYSHQGRSLGPGMEPNSDRVRVEAVVRPAPRLRATVSGRMLRHANASEGIQDLGLAGHDGTLTDDGRYYHFVVLNDKVDGDGDGDTVGSDPEADATDIYVETGRASYQDDLRFLTQDNIETVLQAGFEVGYTVPLPGRAALTIEAGYDVEYVRNPISWEATGTTAPGAQRDDDDPDPPDVVVYDVVTGDDEINHYAGLRFVFTY